MTPVVEHVRAIAGFCQPVSSLSHFAAAGTAVVAGIPLVRLGKGSRVRVLAIAVYVVCVVAVLVVSGTYHALQWDGPARAMMQHFDYYAIWFLIAGTFTAVHGTMCRGFWRSGVLTFVWGYAATGILLQILWFDIFSGVPGLLLYLGLGWVGLGSVIKLGRQIGYRTVRPIWYAGIAYSVGAVMEAMRQPIVIRHWVGPHEIFHFAVIGGVMIHWLFIRTLLLKHADFDVEPVPAPTGAPVY